MPNSIEWIYSHLFCTLISENQGLDKLRSVSNLMKIPGPAHLIFFSVYLNFFSVCHLNFFQVYGTNLKKIQLTNWKKFRSTEKKFRCAGPEIFLRFETDLNFSRPWFSEMKVQIKWPRVQIKRVSNLKFKSWTVSIGRSPFITSRTFGYQKFGEQNLMPKYC